MAGRGSNHFHVALGNFPPLVMKLEWKRTLRTPSSERFLAVLEGRDAAAADIHYLPDGTVAGTIILLGDATPWNEMAVAELLRDLDEDLLPGVDLGSGRLGFTVVRGEVLGNWEAAERS